MRLTYGVVVLVAVATAGCGSDGDKGVGVGGETKCGEVVPCGGDPTGTWVLTSSCLTPAGQTELNNSNDCAGGSINFTNIDVDGTFTFNADGTYTSTGLTQTASVRLVLPSSCIGGLSCDEAEAGLQSSPEFVSVSCSGSSTCTCNAALETAAQAETGQFTVTGNTLALSGSGGGGSFCVEGTRLHLLSLSDTGIVTEDIVAVRQ